MRLAEFAELAGHVVEGTGQLPQFIAGDDGHELVEVARPDGRRRFGHRPDGHENGADRAGQEEDGQGDAEGQAAAVPHQRGGGEAACGLVGGLHVVLVDLPDAACHLLDLQEGVVQARLAALAEIERTASGLAVGEELVARPAIGDARCGQRIDQFLLAGQGDVVCLFAQVLIEGLPLVLVLLEGLLLAAGQGELEGGVDALQGLVEIAHEDHAVVILAEDLVDLMAEVVDQNDARSPQRDQQGEQGQHGNQDSLAQGHGRALQDVFLVIFSATNVESRRKTRRPRQLRKATLLEENHIPIPARMRPQIRE